MKLLPFRLYRVKGESMTSAIKPGAFLLGSAWLKPKAGHVVVVKREPLSIKRVKKIEGEKAWLEGDNKDASTDSRHYGYVEINDIKAVIFMKLSG